jgi:hypothetical protein
MDIKDKTRSISEKYKGESLGLGFWEKYYRTENYQMDI